MFPGSVSKIQTSGANFKLMENVNRWAEFKCLSSYGPKAWYKPKIKFNHALIQKLATPGIEPASIPEKQGSLPPSSSAHKK